MRNNSNIISFKYENMTIIPNRGEFLIENFLLLIVIPMVGILLGYKEFPFRWVFYLILLVSSLYVLYRYTYIRRMKYHITEEQLVLERGVVTIQRDYLELYRVVDYDERRNFFEQLLGLKTVTIHSGDRRTPFLEIKGVKENVNLVDIIRERVEYNKIRKGVYELTNR